MISVDTTFLIDLWRNRSDRQHPAVRVLKRFETESFCVPVHAAGEFLEGAASVSEKRTRESLVFLNLFNVTNIGIETARHYAVIVAHLRKQSLLKGASKPDMWIAASAVEHASPLVTRNVKHYESVPDLTLIPY